MDKRHILVLGAGSVGKRHLNNFAELGCVLSAMDPREDRLNEASKEVNLEMSFSNLEDALESVHSFDGVVIGSPPKYHVQQCVEFAKKGIPMLLEKPVSPTLQEALKLDKVFRGLSFTKLLLGYTYRWWPPLSRFYDYLKSGKVGKLLYGKFVMSAHLADWHPWEPYKDFFMASKDLGGGALLDESHFIDLMIRFFGMPTSLFAKVEKLSSLEIETDDNVEMIAIYDDGLRVSIHLDLYTRPHERYIAVTGEKGTLRWSFDPNTVSYSNEMNHEWEIEEFNYERNDMFVKVAEEFIRLLDGHSELTCTLNDGINALSIVEACRESSRLDKMVLLSERSF